MALSDLAVFSEYTYRTMTEVVAQQIELFNSASAGAIVLRPAAHQGDFSDSTLFAKISGLVKRRNAYGSGAVTPKKMQHLIDTMVKVAAGTPPIEWDASQYAWIQQNEADAGVALGTQLAGDMLADMLNAALASLVPVLKANAAVVHDISALTGGAELASFVALNNASGKFGDRSTDIVAWVAHSKVMTDLFNNALNNASQLFSYSTVNVVRDPFGRLFVVTDAPALLTAGAPNKYTTPGLTVGAIDIGQNNDFTDNVQTTNGDENIKRNYQAEWSYELGLKGYSWDKTNGGKSPGDAALQTATNWDKFATSNKDTAGVALVSQ